MINTAQLRPVLFAVASLFSVSAAAQSDQAILDLLDQPEQLAAGETAFNSICASCHKKDLSGATGFNLKDSEWVHGSAPSDIYKNIQNGFAQAGMPAFKGMFSDQQIKQITAYILSKREGWDNLTYKVFELAEGRARDWDQVLMQRAVKSGSANKNMPDFNIPENEEFAYVLSGDFYAPRDQDARLSVHAPHTLLEVYIDGEKVAKKGNAWRGSYPLKRGKQHLEFRLMTPPKPFPKYTRTNASLIVTNDAENIKLFPASKRAVQQLAGTNFPITATNSEVVQRKVVIELPPYSVAVGLPQKMNYAFNTRSCAIVGAWKGDLLNIGPNIKERGQDGSVPLGDWLFHAPEQIKPLTKDCDFIKYTRRDATEFEFTLADTRLSVAATQANNQTLTLTYKVLGGAKPTQLKFALPRSKQNKYQINGGQLVKQGPHTQWHINTAQNKTFSIQLSAVGEL
ncbi:c-type cytochrome [Gayadomonas joobiniege]|uniref:c-type cytochrome n=1 Tax=Gayadomonas joobiniege TaxID=1234606 RepID=UPI0003681A04|nr:c-type cytochrome [Gayadomonas joobiniege]